MHLIILLFDIFLFDIFQIINIDSISNFHDLRFNKIMKLALRIRVILFPPIYLTYYAITFIYYFGFFIVLQFSLSECQRMKNCWRILACYCCSILKINGMETFVKSCALVQSNFNNGLKLTRNFISSSIK